MRDILPKLGPELVVSRVVQDRNGVTAGGITAGIDFGLRAAANLRGEDYARFLTMALEYDPQPPYGSGMAEKATPAVGKMSHPALIRCIRHFMTRPLKLERSGYLNWQVWTGTGEYLDEEIRPKKDNLQRRR